MSQKLAQELRSWESIKCDSGFPFNVISMDIYLWSEERRRKTKRKGKHGKCIYQPLSITFSLKVDCLRFKFSLHFKGFLWKAKCLIILFLGFEWQAKSLKCAGSASRLTYQWQPTSYKGFLCFFGRSRFNLKGFVSVRESTSYKGFLCF